MDSRPVQTQMLYLNTLREQGLRPPGGASAPPGPDGAASESRRTLLAGAAGDADDGAGRSGSTPRPVGRAASRGPDRDTPPVDVTNVAPRR